MSPPPKPDSWPSTLLATLVAWGGWIGSVDIVATLPSSMQVNATLGALWRAGYAERAASAKPFYRVTEEGRAENVRRGGTPLVRRPVYGYDWARPGEDVTARPAPSQYVRTIDTVIEEVSAGEPDGLALLTAMDNAAAWPHRIAGAPKEPTWSELTTNVCMHPWSFGRKPWLLRRPRRKLMWRSAVEDARPVPESSGNPLVRAFANGAGRVWQDLTLAEQLDHLPRVREIIAVAARAPKPVEYAWVCGRNFAVDLLRRAERAPRMQARIEERESAERTRVEQEARDRTVLTYALTEMRALSEDLIARNPRMLLTLTLVWRIYLRGETPRGHGEVVNAVKYRQRLRERVAEGTALAEVLDWHRATPRPHVADIRAVLDRWPVSPPLAVRRHDDDIEAHFQQPRRMHGR